MDALIQNLSKKIDELELSSIQECVVESTAQTHYTMNHHCATVLMLDPAKSYSAEHIMKTLNTYLWNNSLLCGNKIIKLNDPLKQAIHYYEPTIHYSELVVKICRLLAPPS
jgi:hypothetical protein